MVSCGLGPGQKESVILRLRLKQEGRGQLKFILGLDGTVKERSIASIVNRLSYCPERNALTLRSGRAERIVGGTGSSSDERPSPESTALRFYDSMATIGPTAATESHYGWPYRNLLTRQLRCFHREKRS